MAPAVVLGEPEVAVGTEDDVLRSAARRRRIAILDEVAVDGDVTDGVGLLGW